KEKENTTLSPSVSALPTVPNCPHQEIIAAYHKYLPTLPQVRVWNDSRKKKLVARWREETARQNVDWWRDLFSWIASCNPHLIGDNERQWTADLEWIVTANNFIKVIEGKCQRKGEDA
ncbi:hypothetical protein BOW52_08255, partial [Solemya elarraichensis gill symbiont]